MSRSFFSFALMMMVVVAAILMTVTSVFAQSSGPTGVPTFQVCNNSTNAFAVPPQTQVTLGYWNQTGEQITVDCFFASTTSHLLLETYLFCSRGTKVGPFATIKRFESNYINSGSIGTFVCPFGTDSVWGIAGYNSYPNITLDVAAVGYGTISSAFSSSSEALIPHYKIQNHHQQQQVLHQLSGQQQQQQQICGSSPQLTTSVAQNQFAYFYWQEQGSVLQLTCIGAFTDITANRPLATQVMVACATNLNFDQNRVILGRIEADFSPVFDRRFVCPFAGFFAVVWVNQEKSSRNIMFNAAGEVGF